MVIKLFRWFGLTIIAFSGTALAHDFDTTATVRYVVECMADLGGQSDENLYTCSCRLNALGEKMSYEDYGSARKFKSYKLMPGEKGALFRDNPNGDVMIAKWEEAQAYADASCLTVKRVALPPASRAQK